MKLTRFLPFIVAMLLFSSYSNATDFYWVTGSGNWSDTNSWSLTSGGGPVVSLPTATDNVIFDNNSGLLGIADVVTMDIPVVVTNFDYSLVSNAFTIASALASIEIQGSLSANGLANITWGGIVNMNPSVVANFILSNGTNWGNEFHCIGSEAILLADNFTSSSDFYVDNGGLNSSGFTLTIQNFYSNSPSSRTIDLSNSIINVNDVDWDIDATTLTFTTSSSIINLLNTATFNFTGGSQAYDTLISSASLLNMYGNNSFSLAVLSPSSEWSLDNGSNQQVDSLNTSGDCFSNTVISTLNPALTAASIEKTGFNVFNASSLNIINVNAITGGGQVYNLSLSDTTDALDWNFVGTAYYWISNGGNWNDINHWSFSSGGPIAGCIPSPEDSVYFDAASFAVLNDTVFVDMPSYFGLMDWSAATNNPNLKLNAPLYSYGDITLNPIMSLTSQFNGIEIKRLTNLTSASVNVNCFINVNTDDDLDQLALQDDLHVDDAKGILLFRGELHTNSDSLSAGFIRVFERATTDLKRIQLDNSYVRLKSGFSADSVTTEFVFDAGNSHVYVGDTSYQNYVITDMASMTFWDLTLDYHEALSDQVLSGPNFTYNKLKILKGSHVVIDSLSIHTVNDSLLIVGTCIDSIYLSSSNSTMACSINKTTASNVIAECIAFNGIGAGGVALTANYSLAAGPLNPNWTINTVPPVSAAFSAPGPFCFGDTAIFNNLSTVLPGLTNDYTLYWDFDDGGAVYNDLTIDSASHVFTAGGDFDVSMVAEFSNFCTDTALTTIHINKPNVFLLSSDFDQIICENVTVTFEANSTTSGATFEYFINGVSQNTPSINDTLLVTNSLVDQDSVSVVTYENGCPTPNPASLVFTVLAAPVFSWTSSDADTTICQNDLVSFSHVGGAPTNTYRFLINGLVQTSYIYPGVFSTSALNNLDVVQIVGKNTSNCRDTLSMTFTVNPLPITTLTSSAPTNVICTGDNVTFTAGGADTYEFFVAGVSQGIQASNTWSTTSLTSGQIVSVIGYNTFGCQKQAPTTYSYTVNPLPNVNMNVQGGLTTICSGTNVTVTASGASLYELFINNVSQGAASATSVYNLPSLANGDEVFIQGGFSGCLNQSDTVTFTVLSSPTTTLASDDADQIICSTDQVIFTANGATNYQFFVNGVSQGPASATNIFTTTSLTNGQTVSVQGESNTCIVSQALTFTVLPIPSVSLFSNDIDNTICEGETITFTGANANQYELFVNSISQGAPQASPTFNPVLTSGLNAVYVIGTAANGCTNNSTTINVQVNPIPVITLSSSDFDNIICEGESITFSGTGSDLYQFYLNGVSQGSLSATNTYSNSNLANGATVYIYGSSLGCTSTSNSIVTTVNPIPTINFTSTDVDNVFCEGDIVDFNATGATNYEFFVDGVSQGPASPVNNINSLGFTAGNYLIDVIGESNTCTDNSSISVVVQALPIASISSSDIDNIICSGESVTYTGSGGSLFEFFVNGVSQGAFSPLNTFNTSSLVNGDVVSVVVTSPQGCSDPETMTAITVNATPIVTLLSSDVDQIICLNDNVIFTGAGSSEYEFFVNGVSQGPMSPTNIFSSSTLANGDVITLNGSTSGCTGASSSLNFTVYNPPLVTLANNSDTLLCTAELTDLTAAGATNYQFLVNGNPVGGSTSNPNFNGALNNGDVVTVIGETNGCPSAAATSFTYTVYTYPSLASIASPGTTICLNDVVSFNATGALTYEYAINGVTVQNGITTNYSTSSLIDGDVVSVTGYNGDCASNPMNYTFTVNTMQLDLLATPSNLICEGENVTFTATGGMQYEFFVNGVSQGALSPTNTFSSAALIDGDEVTFTAYNSGTGCTQAYGDYIIMNVIDEPVISSNTSLQFCEGDSVVLVSNAPYGNQWYLNGSPIAGATDTSYTVYDSGTYSLEVTGGGDGDVWSFGLNGSGNLGTADNLNYADPTIAATTQTFTTLSSGYKFVLAITTGGGVFAWGDNEFGQLGDGTYADKNVPQTVPTLSNIKAIATTETSSMAVTSTGELYVWGNNDEGQLATGNTSVINFPFLNVNVNNVDSIAGGRNHFVFLKNDGTVWTVGNNDYGQLGQGTLNGSMNPLQVPLLTNIVSIGAGEYHSFAINALGDLFVWGNNGSGQLGLNDLTNRLSPTPSPLKNIINAQGGANHSVLLSSDKKVYTCGGNVYGQLGTNNYTNSLVPVLANVSGAVMISAGEYSTLVRRGDNTVYGFGNNAEDQLSSPSGNTVATPEIILDVEGVTFIEASQSSSHLIYGDGATCVSQSVATNLLTSPQATISAIGDTLSTVFASSYQWYFNGLPIPGANSQTLVASNSGNYFVEVTYANGCTSTSPTLYHSMTAINALAIGGVKIYPNPAGNKINVSIEGVIPDELVVAIHDQTGRLISTYNHGSTNFVSLDIHSLNPGVYYMVLSSGQLSGTVKFIKLGIE